MATTKLTKREQRLQQLADSIIERGVYNTRKLYQATWKLDEDGWLDLVSRALCRIECAYLNDTTSRKALHVARLEALLADPSTTAHDKVAIMRELNKMFSGCLAPIRNINTNVAIEGPSVPDVVQRMLDEDGGQRALAQDVKFLSQTTAQAPIAPQTRSQEPTIDA